MTEAAQIIGFPSPPVRERPVVVQPRPLPKRPKGQWFIGALLASLVAAGGYLLWDGFFRYAAYGVVQCDLVQVHAAWKGPLKYLHVREGQEVNQGTPLATLDSLELRQVVAQLEDDISVAQAEMDGEIARLKWESALALDQDGGAVAEHYETWGRLMQEEALLADKEQSLARVEQLHKSRAVTADQLEHARHERDGQKAKVEKYRAALAETKRRSELADSLLKQGVDLGGGILVSGNDRLKPFVAKIAALQAKRQRVQELLAAGQVCAPTAGTVVQTHFRPGETVGEDDPLATLQPPGGLKLVLYVTQAQSNGVKPGDELSVIVEPYSTQVNCSVERIGTSFEVPPEQLRKFYPSGHKLLPIYLTPDASAGSDLALRSNAVIKVSWLGWNHRAARTAGP